MRRRIIAAVVLILVLGGGGAWWLFGHNGSGDGDLVLYGNVDLRQVDLAFNDSGRIDSILVDEGARVKAGDVLARLDTSRITPQIAQAEAQVAAQAAVVDKLKAGSRPEEIAQASANVDAANASAVNAHLTFERLTTLREKGSSSVTQSQVDAAKAALDQASAQVEVAEQALVLAKAGPRAEDVTQAEEQLKAAQAQLALLRQQLKDANLVAPTGGVVRSRLLEPGEIASPQKPVLSLAIVDPKWVRTYVSEIDLAKIAPGTKATVTVDGDPGHPLSGHVGFISPVAEFTPRSIQTAELRTSLVYEVRVLVDDPKNVLRLGMPATVTIATGAGTATAGQQ